jgi:hypothetical protein
MSKTDKSRIYAVLSKKKKVIYAVNKTELQAYQIAERLIKEKVCDDASVLCNSSNQLMQKRYDKYVSCNEK